MNLDPMLWSFSMFKSPSTFRVLSSIIKSLGLHFRCCCSSFCSSVGLLIVVLFSESVGLLIVVTILDG